MSKFQGCLKFGIKYQVETLKYLNFVQHNFSAGREKTWDICIKENKDDKFEDLIFYEVKAETTASKTGNICIEYEYNNELSGIACTKAQYWVHYVVHNDDNKEYDIYIIPTNQLKKLIQKKEYIRDCSGGDGNKSKMYLFNVNHPMIQKYKRDYIKDKEEEKEEIKTHEEQIEEKLEEKTEQT